MKVEVLEPLISQQDEMMSQSNIPSSLPKGISEIQKTLDFIQSLRSSTFEELYSKKRGQVKETFQCLKSIHYNKSLKLLAYQTKNNYITVRSSETEQRKSSIKAYSEYITSICISNDGNYLTYGSEDKNIRLWDLSEGRMAATLKGHSSPVKSVVFTNNSQYLISGSADCIIKFWNLSKRKEEFWLKDHTKAINCLIINKDDSLLASGSDDCRVKLWDIKSKAMKQTLEGSNSEILCLAFSPDEEILAGGSKSSGILLWNLGGGSKCKSITKETCSINSLSFTEFMLLISGSADGIINIFDSEGELIQSFKEDNTVESFYVSDKKIGILLKDLSLKTRTLEYNQDDIYLKDYEKPITGTNFCSDDLLIVSVEGQGVEIWNYKEKKILNEMSSVLDLNKVTNVGFVKSTSVLIAYTNDKLLVKNFADPDKSKSVSDEERFFDSVWITKDESFLIITGSYFGMSEIRKWNLSTFEDDFLISCENPQEGKFCLLSSLSPDDHYCVVSYNHMIQAYDLTSDDREHYIYSIPEQPVPSMKIFHSPNGELLACFWDSNQVKILEASTGKTSAELQATENFLCVQFSPDSKNLITASKQQPLFVWEIETKEIKFKVNIQYFCVTALTFSPDKEFLLCSNTDGVLLLLKVSKNLIPWKQEEDETIQENMEEMLKHFKSIEIKTTREQLSFDTTSILAEESFDNQEYCDTLYFIMREDYESITESNWNRLISNLNYTPLHFAAFKGETSSIEQLMKNSYRLNILADALGKSPLFYSIFYHHRRVTDLLISYLVKVSENGEFQMYFDCFNAIKNDLPKIIENSSKELFTLLEKSIFISQEPPQFGVLKEPIKFLESRFANFEDFAISQEGSGEPLRINYSVFTLPSNIGSESSILLLQSFLKSTEKEIFKTSLVESFIRCRWRELVSIIYMHTIFLWLNLLMLLMLFTYQDNLSDILFLITFILINIVLVLWEGIQMIQTSKAEYFSDWWNYVDILRIILSFTWLVFRYFQIHYPVLSWFTVLFNIIRGVSGFRAFSTTRLYIQLITNSLKSIAHFLSIFFYTTFCFGFLLHTSSEQLTEISFGELWAKSFGMAIGDIDEIKSHEFTLQYVTFFIAVVINVVLMLNMLISILGDSFDEFQLFCIFYDNKEMTQVVLEIEYILSLTTPLDTRMHLHICENYYKTTDDIWEGKVIDLRKIIDSRVSVLERKLESIESKLDRLVPK